MTVIPRPCLGCGRVQTKGSYCPTCKQVKERQREQRRGTQAERGLGYQHRKRSKQAREEQPWCSNPDCMSTENLQLDHKLPRAVFGPNDGPTQVLCGRCNARKGSRVE